MGKKRKDDINRPLMALLPGAKINSERRKISVRVGISTETLIFNIGGVKFETYRSTLLKQPESPLSNEKFLQKHYRPEYGDYFFDKDPDMFKVILSYLRTGELHMPPYVCGPAAKAELDFWGVPDSIIEHCCYSHYNSYNSALEALNRLEKDRHGSFDVPSPERSHAVNMSKWENVRMQATLILNHPEASTQAKIYGLISLCVVAASIVSFLADSHPFFHKIKITNGTMATVNATVNNTMSMGRQEILESHPVLRIIDMTCMMFFTFEYILRLFFVNLKWRYVKSTMGLIDLFALLPDYIQLIMLAVNPSLVDSPETKIITVLKVTRILRIFRLVRHVPGLWILIYTLKASVRELMLMIAFLCVGMLIFSSLIYYAEDRQTFTSIPHSFWWAIITMTTVGYGDMYPVTELGYVIGSFTAMSGLLMIGFSVPILVNNFLMYYQHVQFALQDEKRKRRNKVEERRNKDIQTIDKYKCSENNNTFV